jgi:hypothetical protein
MKFDNMSESADCIRIELDPRPAFQLLQGFSERTPSAIWAITRDRIKGIGYR